MIRLPRALVWTCAIVLALAFVLVGLSKLDGASAARWSERFARWGYPAGAQYAVGVLEVLGGVGVLIPRWRRPATAMLVVIMIGALCTHLLNGEFPRLVPPLLLGGLAFLLFASSSSSRAI